MNDIKSVRFNTFVLGGKKHDLIFMIGLFLFEWSLVRETFPVSVATWLLKEGEKEDREVKS